MSSFILLDVFLDALSGWARGKVYTDSDLCGDTDSDLYGDTDSHLYGATYLLIAIKLTAQHRTDFVSFRCGFVSCYFFDWGVRVPGTGGEQLATSSDTESEVRSEAFWVVLNAASCGSDAQVNILSLSALIKSVWVHY